MAAVNKTKEQIRYALEKAGKPYREDVRYVLTTPANVPKHLQAGLEKLASFEAHLGEKLVVMGQPEGKRG